MVYKLFFTLVALFVFTSLLPGQENEKKIPDDPEGISYSKVFENMHYNQTYRPQVHYTTITGEVGDATGLILYKGTYHLFYMFDEWSKRRKYNKNWGHAVSNDLIFWEQKPQILNTILDNRPGSGSGIVDWNNTLGLQSGVEKTLAVFYSDYGRGTCIAFSKDAGETWIRHKANPVISMPQGVKNRDSFVFWYKPTQSWRMVLYEKSGFVFYKSDNLLDWEYLSTLEGFYECPDLLFMPVDENKNNKKWVIINGDGTYRIGNFNGIEFTSEMEENRKVDYGVTYDLYATQTWKQSYEGDGPFLQMGSLRGRDISQKTEVWNKQQCFPCELTLKTINGEIRLCRNPVASIKQLRGESYFWKDELVKPGENPLADLDGDVFEIIAEIETGTNSELGFIIRGEKLTYTVKEQLVSFMGSSAFLSPLGMSTGSSQMVKFRLIVDRSSIEVFANYGEVTFSKLFCPELSNMDLELFSSGGSATIRNMEIYRLESIWLKREQELGYYRTIPGR